MMSDFTFFLPQWSSYWDNVLRASFGSLFEGQGHIKTFPQNSFRPKTLWFVLNFTTISQKWSVYWDNVSRVTFRLLPWRPMSQHDVAAKSCLAQNLVIWNRILQLILTNFSVSNTYSGSITRFWPALVVYQLFSLYARNKSFKAF